MYMLIFSYVSNNDVHSANFPNTATSYLVVGCSQGCSRANSLAVLSWLLCAILTLVINLVSHMCKDGATPHTSEAVSLSLDW